MPTVPKPPRTYSSIALKLATIPVFLTFLFYLVEVEDSFEISVLFSILLFPATLCFLLAAGKCNIIYDSFYAGDEQKALRYSRKARNLIIFGLLLILLVILVLVWMSA